MSRSRAKFASNAMGIWTRKWGWALGLICALPACDQSTQADLQASDVLQIKLCPDRSGTSCTGVADGETPVRVSICTPVQADRVSALSVEATLSSGSFRAIGAGTPQTATFSLARNPCADLQLVPSRKPLPIEIVARFDAYRTQAFLPVAAATLSSIEVSAQPLVLQSTTSTTVTLSAVVRTSGIGEPSEGTVVRFEVIDVQPAGIPVSVLPDRRRISYDSAAGSVATSQLYVGSKATQVTVRVTAVPPLVEGDGLPPSPPSISQTVTLPAIQ